MDPEGTILVKMFFIVSGISIHRERAYGVTMRSSYLSDQMQSGRQIWLCEFPCLLLNYTLFNKIYKYALSVLCCIDRLRELRCDFKQKTFMLLTVTPQFSWTIYIYRKG